MSDFHFHPAFDHHPFTGGQSILPPSKDLLTESRQADRAIDAALRSVPLPQGLMTRLGQLVYAMPDESADHVDWLGC
jgi:hypothetical protein